MKSPPEPVVEGRMPYLPALDGLRAIALLAVLAFHAGFTWIHGGYLPLTAFFVLSGFLITSLLLLERQRSGRIDLIAFWGRRARRLVPAAILALVLIAVYAAVVDRPMTGLRGDVFAALGWVANWRFIFDHRAYADLFGDPSPLQHFWSLAVEEQFYVVMPPIVVGALYLARGRRWLLGAVTATLVVASTLTMRILHEPGDPPLRVYFGTDTRAAEILVGVLLALVLIGPRGLRRFTGRARLAIDLAGAAALAVSVVLWFVTREFDSRLYEGGLLGISLLAAVVVTAGTQPDTVVSRVLAFRPIAALGRISYGVYLFHWPLFLWINEARTGLERGPLFVLRITVTVLLAMASYHLVEHPLRVGSSLRPRLMLTGWANATVAVAAVLVVVTSSTSPALDTVRTADEGTPSVIRATDHPTSTTVTTATGPEAPAGTSATTRPRTSTTATPTTATPTTAPLPPLKVMVVGDSLARNLAGGIEAHLKKTGDIVLLSYAFDGCPVVIDGIMRWPGDGSEHTVPSECAPRKAEWAGQIRSFDPDVVLIHSSIFDILDRKVPGWADFRTIGDPVFDDWLRAGQRQAVSTLGSGGATVVWATTPCATFDTTFPNHHENGEGNRRIDLLNVRIGQSGATIADLDGKVCPGGGFTSTVAGVNDARPDGVHLTPAAAEALTDQWLAPLLLSLRP